MARFAVLARQSGAIAFSLVTSEEGSSSLISVSTGGGTTVFRDDALTSDRQEICDGILTGHDETLVREFPFLRWGSNLTKPDWSKEELRLWVELKYVRKKEDIRQIGAAIAEDITKYGDNERNVLYIVYDPEHLITDEREFAEPMLKRPAMQVRFIR